jgi:hypothetical protein
MSYAKDMLDKLNTNKEKAGKSLLLEEKTGILIGGGIGLGIGLYIAYSRGYNLLIGSLIGASIGALIVNFNIKNSNEK